MKTIHLIFCLAFLTSGPAAVLRAKPPAATQPATHAADSAEAAARRYSDLLKSGHGLEAIKNFWDLDVMFDTMFGDHMKEVGDADRARMRAQMLAFLQKIYADPKIAATMSSARFTGFATREVDADHVEVSFTVEFEKTTVPNSLMMVKRDGNWRVVDAATSGRGLVGLVQKDYAANAAKVSPQVYIQAITAAQ
jgi:ABC-type transporter MlaC component